MFAPKLPLAIAVAALTAAGSMLASADVAAAKAGDRTYEQTYPRASGLCADVAAGGGPRRLGPSAAQVLAGCATLKSGFESVHGTVLAAQAQFTSSVTADRAAIAAVCRPPVANRPLCRGTRRSERAAIRALRREHRAAVRLYYRTVEANRRAFWAAIHALRGGASIPADAPIPQQPS
jgi:hypothetical protein